MNELSEHKARETDRWTLVRDIAVLQAKLLVDGLRDLILVPASLVAGIASLMSGNDGKPGTQFYHLLGVGKQSERWINLFGALRNAPPDMEHAEPFPDADTLADKQPVAPNAVNHSRSRIRQDLAVLATQSKVWRLRLRQNTAASCRTNG